MNLTVKTEKKQLTITLNNSFDVSHYEAFKALCKQYDSPDMSFVIDFSNTLYMDSSALGMLLLLREQTKGDKARVKLVNVSGSVFKVLELAHFGQLFNISEP